MIATSDVSDRISTIKEKTIVYPIHISEKYCTISLLYGCKVKIESIIQGWWKIALENVGNIFFFSKDRGRRLKNFLDRWNFKSWRLLGIPWHIGIHQISNWLFANLTRINCADAQHFVLKNPDLCSRENNCLKLHSQKMGDKFSNNSDY